MDMKEINAIVATSKDKNLPLTVAGIIFTLVAASHLSRLIFRFDIVIAGYNVPIAFNGIGFIIALVLAIWMFRAKKR